MLNYSRRANRILKSVFFLAITAYHLKDINYSVIHVILLLHWESSWMQLCKGLDATQNCSSGAEVVVDFFSRSEWWVHWFRMWKIWVQLCLLRKGIPFLQRGTKPLAVACPVVCPVTCSVMLPLFEGSYLREQSSFSHRQFLPHPHRVLWLLKVVFVAVSKTGQGFFGLQDVWHTMAISHVPEHSSPTEDACLLASWLLLAVSGTCQRLPAVYERGQDQNCASHKAI